MVLEINIIRERKGVEIDNRRNEAVFVERRPDRFPVGRLGGIEQ